MTMRVASVTTALLVLCVVCHAMPTSWPVPVVAEQLLRGTADCMSSKPYVEASCQPTTVKGWSHDAMACTYPSPIGHLKVVVADPTAQRVAAWIHNATHSVDATAHLEQSDPDAMKQIRKILAVDVMIQSGRIFPLDGDVGEDMGGGYVAYPFKDGVSVGCPKSEPHCFCRINSLTRAHFCKFRGHSGVENENKCLSRVGYAEGDSDAWYKECRGTHSDAWNADNNPHFDAHLWGLLHDAGITGAGASGKQIEAALYSALELSASTVAKFC